MVVIMRKKENFIINLIIIKQEDRRSNKRGKQYKANEAKNIHSKNSSWWMKKLEYLRQEERCTLAEEENTRS